MIVSNGSYGHGEPKNVIAFSMQGTYRWLRASKVPGFMQRRIGPTMEILGNSGPPISMVPYLPKIMMISKRSYGNGEPKNISLCRCKKPTASCGHANLPGFMQHWIGPTMEFLGKFDATYLDDKVFAPKQWWCQKQATGMESPKM